MKVKSLFISTSLCSVRELLRVFPSRPAIEPPTPLSDLGDDLGFRGQ